MKPSLVAIAAAIALSAGPAFAQEPPAAPRPFPEGAKIAYINIQRIASESAEGKAATAKVKTLNDQKVNDLGERQKALTANQQRLQQGEGVLSAQARAQLEKEIERQSVEIQRFTQDAQAEVQELQQDLQIDFQNKLIPVINAVASEKGLHMVFSQSDSGLVWADTGLDITADVIARFDQVTGASKPQNP